jgi:hypothetical protein
MSTQFNSLLSRLERFPDNDLLWQQVKKLIKQEPEACCCRIFFHRLGKAGSPMESLLQDRGLDIFSEILLFYRTFLDKTQLHGDIWGTGQELWQILQFLEIWSIDLRKVLPSAKLALLDGVLAQLRSVSATRTIPRELTELNLPFLPHEVAWNLAMYLTPAAKLADYPQFTHVHFLPTELIPLAFDLENYKLSPFNERYLETLLHDTRKSAIKACLLNFAQTFPLVLQGKWAYAVYLSLDHGEWCKHPFVRRLLANSYWEARLNGELLSFNSNNKL